MNDYVEIKKDFLVELFKFLEVLEPAYRLGFAADILGNSDFYDKNMIYGFNDCIKKYGAIKHVKMNGFAFDNNGLYQFPFALSVKMSENSGEALKALPESLREDIGNYELHPDILDLLKSTSPDFISEKFEGLKESNLINHHFHPEKFTTYIKGYFLYLFLKNKELLYISSKQKDKSTTSIVEDFLKEL